MGERAAGANRAHAVVTAGPLLQLVFDRLQRFGCRVAQGFGNTDFMNAADGIQRQVVGVSAKGKLKLFRQAIQPEKRVGHDGGEHRRKPACDAYQPEREQVAEHIRRAVSQQGIGKGQRGEGNAF